MTRISRIKKQQPEGHPLAAKIGRTGHLAFPALLGLRADQFDWLGHFPTYFFLEDFTERNVCRAQICRVGNERTAQTAATGIKLAHAARDKIDEDIWVADLFGSFLAEFSVHNILVQKVSGKAYPLRQYTQ